MAADDGRGGFPGQLHVPGIRRVKCGMPTCDQEVIVKPSKLLAGLAGKEVNQAQMVWFIVAVFSMYYALSLRMLQFCASHEMKEKQFLDQAKRAGKAEYLAEIYNKDPAQYAELFANFANTCLVAQWGLLCINNFHWLNWGCPKDEVGQVQVFRSLIGHRSPKSRQKANEKRKHGYT